MSEEVTYDRELLGRMSELGNASQEQAVLDTHAFLNSDTGVAFIQHLIDSKNKTIPGSAHDQIYSNVMVCLDGLNAFANRRVEAAAQAAAIKQQAEEAEAQASDLAAQAESESHTTNTD